MKTWVARFVNLSPWQLAAAGTGWLVIGLLRLNSAGTRAAFEGHWDRAKIAVVAWCLMVGAVHLVLAWRRWRTRSPING